MRVIFLMEPLLASHPRSAHTCSPVIGTQIVQLLIPALGGLEVGPIIGQVTAAAASGAVLTVVTGALSELAGAAADKNSAIPGRDRVTRRDR